MIVLSSPFISSEHEFRFKPLLYDDYSVDDLKLLLTEADFALAILFLDFERQIIFFGKDLLGKHSYVAHFPKLFDYSIIQPPTSPFCKSSGQAPWNGPDDAEYYCYFDSKVDSSIPIPISTSQTAEDSFFLLTHPPITSQLQNHIYANKHVDEHWHELCPSLFSISFSSSTPSLSLHPFNIFDQALRTNILTPFLPLASFLTEILPPAFQTELSPVLLDGDEFSPPHVALATLVASVLPFLPQTITSPLYSSPSFSSLIPPRFYQPTSNHIDRIACLFSGGLDSTIVSGVIGLIIALSRKEAASQHSAPASHQNTDHVHLLNLSFGPPFDSPDRTTGIASFSDLSRCPIPSSQSGSPLILDNLNIPSFSTSPLRDSLFPALTFTQTVMDFSLASPFYVGSMFILKTTPSTPEPSTLLLFSGLGADEMAGGYGHHHTPFVVPQNFHHPPLVQSVSLSLTDISKFWIRNCARDDRVVTQAASLSNAFMMTSTQIHSENSSMSAFTLTFEPSSEQQTLSATRSIHLATPFLSAPLIALLFRCSFEEVVGFSSERKTNKHPPGKKKKKTRTAPPEIVPPAQPSEPEPSATPTPSPSPSPCPSESPTPNVFLCGDKRIFREVALLLGLNNAAHQPKRAMQFGTRSAKLTRAKGPEHMEGFEHIWSLDDLATDHS
ncbi:hypothetical protein BLNAU_7561 [Blattamonas nauphoetae]|uniref:Uncharacterized protein n=1 Tax=Blattamonas nauphoetae TaxID=2049346 RepID=A0ABQ9Y0Y8_9EUKA|nr:hypothetical protein BLNAU_7561 [Blattamonas nauphoetae]